MILNWQSCFSSKFSTYIVSTPLWYAVRISLDVRSIANRLFSVCKYKYSKCNFSSLIDYIYAGCLLLIVFIVKFLQACIIVTLYFYCDGRSTNKYWFCTFYKCSLLYSSSVVQYLIITIISSYSSRKSLRLIQGHFSWCYFISEW